MFLLKDISWVFVLFILRSWLWEIIGKAKAVQSPVGFFHLMMNMQNLNVLLKDPYTLSTLIPLLSALSKQALATILSIYLSRHNWGGVTFSLLPQYSYGSMDSYHKYGNNNFQEFYMSEEKWHEHFKKHITHPHFIFRQGLPIRLDWFC